MWLIVTPGRPSYNKPMTRRPRNQRFFLAGIIGLAATTWFINRFEPTGIRSLILFFLLLFLTSSGLLTYLFNNVRRGALGGIGVVVALLLRLWGLHDPIYLILLIACLISVELLFSKK